MWHRNDIPIYLEPITWLAKNHGLIASVYGSVITEGSSNHDLDILIVKYVDNPDIESFLKDMCLYFKGSIVDVYKGLFADGYSIRMAGRILDLSIRR